MIPSPFIISPAQVSENTPRISQAKQRRVNDQYTSNTGDTQMNTLVRPSVDTTTLLYIAPKSSDQYL